jgi:type III pantothenate kinase
MILLVDIGNTNITTGVYQDKILDIMYHSTPLSSEYGKRLKHYLAHRHMSKPEKAILCSVVPQATSLLKSILKRHYGVKPIIVSHKLETGLKFCIKNPGLLGADRIANAVAAHKLYKGHVIVIDFGTATTFCTVSAQGEFLGGVIMPGVGISINILSEMTAQLPRIKLKTPQKILGRDTQNNMLAGVVLGQAGAVERIIKEIKREIIHRGQTREKTPVSVVATGGFAHIMTPYIRSIRKVNAQLTLAGLRYIYEMNV